MLTLEYSLVSQRNRYQLTPLQRTPFDTYYIWDTDQLGVGKFHIGLNINT